MPRTRVHLFVALALASAACTAEPKSAFSPTSPPADSGVDTLGVVVTAPGMPVPGLTAGETQSFGLGLQVFGTTFTPASGLGPLFNSNSCVACHSDPSPGGYGDSVEVHATAYHPGQACDELTAQGGPVVQQHVTPALATAFGIVQEPVPAGATAVGHRSTPLIFGLGLIDAVSDATILALARIRYPDGVHGRAAILSNGRVGRFGRKANTASLDEFNAGAFFNEMGITNALNPVENTVAGQPLPTGVDPAPDPELNANALAAAEAFVRFLGPVAPLPKTPETRLGQVLFVQTRCSNCHIPLLFTGNSPSPALRHKWFRAYSDLLLHDMGDSDADICNGAAKPSEFRTQPLIGMQFLDMFMHDGESSTIPDAILRHGGEGAAARARFQALTPSDQAALVAFVQSL